MKIVPRIRPLDDHHKKIPPIVKVSVAYRRFELVGVLLDPVFQINWRLHGSHNVSVFRPSEASNPSSADTEDWAGQAQISYLDAVDFSVGIPCAAMNFPISSACALTIERKKRGVHVRASKHPCPQLEVTLSRAKTNARLQGVITRIDFNEFTGNNPRSW